MDNREGVESNKAESENESDNKVAVKSSKGKRTSKKSNSSKKRAGRKSSKRPVAAKANFQKGQRPFPRVTLEEALQVATVIKEYNGGNPWDTADVANALNVGAKTNRFYYLTAASRDFGLTIGTRETAKIELNDLGRDIVYAPNPQVEHEKKIEAFLNIQIFKRVLEHYKGSSLPEMKYLGNTLEKEFDLDPDVHEEFSALFRRNCQELGIEAGVDGLQQLENIDGTSNAPATIVLGELKGSSKSSLKAFVIMPFVEKNEDHPKGFFTEVLRSLITPAALDAGFTVETANKQGSDIIQSTIINDLLEADLVIADFTAHNPNVLFELGVRMAQDKPVALGV